MTQTTNTNITIIRKAEMLAIMQHRNQFRDDGQPFINHPWRVALAIAQLAPDDHNLIAAAWLHDVVEDTPFTEERLRAEFGDDITDLVMEVTKEGQKDHKGYYFPRLKTPRGIALKMVDRADNINDMTSSWSAKRQRHYLGRSKFWRSEA